MEDWVINKVETPAAKQINAYLKEKLIRNQIVETKYNDLLEPIRKQYATMNIWGNKASIRTVTPKLDKKLLVLEPRGRARANAVISRPNSPIKQVKRGKPIFPKK